MPSVCGWASEKLTIWWAADPVRGMGTQTLPTLPIFIDSQQFIDIMTGVYTVTFNGGKVNTKQPSSVFTPVAHHMYSSTYCTFIFEYCLGYAISRDCGSNLAQGYGPGIDQRPRKLSTKSLNYCVSHIDMCTKSRNLAMIRWTGSCRAISRIKLLWFEVNDLLQFFFKKKNWISLVCQRCSRNSSPIQILFSLIYFL